MKKLFLLLVLFSFLAGCNDDCTQDAIATKVTSGSSARSADKVIVCHVLGNGDTQTIEINVEDLHYHLSHGDTEGECPTLSDGGLRFEDGVVQEIDCSYELPFIHVKNNGETWLFDKA